ncbi:MAG: VWA domain-containing protein, partial [Oscillospiraceae bacterium]|nr:VWA domain-containing protein [Oscillospiraceae bacterium]
MKKKALAFLLALALCAGLAPLSLGAAALPAMDVVFLVDTSGSMGYEIVSEEGWAIANPLLSATDALRYYVRELTASGLAAFRFALIDYRDYPESTTWEEDYAFRVALDFTADTQAVEEALAGLSTGYGGDYEEAVCSALTEGLSALSWRTDAGKAGILIGDAPALDPEITTG